VTVVERRLEVAGIPALVVEPEAAASRLVLWQTHLGGAKERTLPQLRALAARGCRAVGFDPPDQGERAASDDPRAFATAVLERFRLRMWPLLGQATLEALRVIDATLDATITSVAAGGVSMGGDVAIALAGIDPRIDRVAAVGSTPDWMRPGMTRLDDPSSVVEQGSADSYGQWLRDQLDPAIHLARYRRGVPMRLHCGAQDHHVPQANARAFAEALSAEGRIEIVEHPGLDHFGVCVDDGALEDCVAFLAGD
jgi:pimeloyl-ACP methyl ester carboxylesterase